MNRQASDASIKNTPEVLSVPATGERFMPQEMTGDIELEHLHRYALARELAQGKAVLDIACGEGYGSQLLSQIAESVVGVDISQNVIAHAQSYYKQSNLEFRLGSCDAIPVADNSIDLVVSFETIEHHDQHVRMIEEIKRVLKKNGVLLISTPDKLNYSDIPKFKNEFHIKELYFNEFRALLDVHFKHLKFYGQKMHFCSLSLPIDGMSNRFVIYNGDIHTINKSAGIENPIYIICLASDCKLPTIYSSIFDGTNMFINSFRDYKIKNTYLMSELKRVKSTVSWKITKPLRLVANLPHILSRLARHL